MNHKNVKLAEGLYFVATPIGTARDITLRGLDILANADVIAAEDTRSMRKLLDIHAVPLGDRPLIAYHDHSGSNVRDRLIDYIKDGKSVAYASEAGTPLIADPGYHLAKDVADLGLLVTSAPGPSAILAALTLAGLPTDRFLFEGFLPNSKSQRISQMQELAQVPATLVFYESPKRLIAMLQDAIEVFGPDRPAAYCRELTKKFEDIQRAPLAELVEIAQNSTIKGEIVVLIDRADKGSVNENDLDQELMSALEHLSIRDASEAVARAFGVPKRKVYQRALDLGKER